MKNLKKVLALVLAFACAFTMFAGAALTDIDDISADNLDAVKLLTTLNVIQGDPDGSFVPEREVTRAEMAKMIYVIRNGGSDNADAYKTVSTSFTDISGHWAEGYIKYLQNTGIVAGKSATRFDPDSQVTTGEAMKMALVLGGYRADKAELTGTQWLKNTVTLATTNGLTKDVNSAIAGGSTRQDAAQILANVLSMTAVQWSEFVEGFVNDSESGLAIGGQSITVGRKWMELWTSVGTLTVVDGQDLRIAQTQSDIADSDKDDAGATVAAFTKVGTDYSELLGQKVKVLFADGKDNQVIGVVALADNQIITVTAGEVSKDDAKIKINGTKYSLEQYDAVNNVTNNDQIAVYLNQALTGQVVRTWTSDTFDARNLAQDASLMTFIDSDNNGKLDAAIVDEYVVAKTTYVGSDSVIVGNESYDFAEENIDENLAKDDWAVISYDRYDDCRNINKVETVTGTVSNVKVDENAADGEFYQYMIDGTWYDSAVLTDGTNVRYNTTDINTVRAGDSVNAVIYNGVVFMIKRTSDDNSFVTDAALVVSKDDTTLAGKQMKLLFFNGDDAIVDFDTDSEHLAWNAVNEGAVYSYDIANGDYMLGNLTVEEDYYNGFTWQNGAAVAWNGTNTTIGGVKIADTAKILLWANDGSTKVITGKQFKSTIGTADLPTDTTNLIASFNAEMDGLNRVGAAAFSVAAIPDELVTKDHYAYIVGDASWSRVNSEVTYTIWTGTEYITVKEDHTRLNDRVKGSVIGYSSLDAIDGSDAKKINDVKYMNMIEAAVETVNTKQDAFTIYGGGDFEIDNNTVVLYVDSSADSDKVGLESCDIQKAYENTNGDMVSNILYYGDLELLVVDARNEMSDSPYVAAIYQEADVVGTFPTRGTIVTAGDITLDGTATSALGDTLDRGTKLDLDFTLDNAARKVKVTLTGATFDNDADDTPYEETFTGTQNDVPITVDGSDDEVTVTFEVLNAKVVLPVDVAAAKINTNETADTYTTASYVDGVKTVSAPATVYVDLDKEIEVRIVPGNTLGVGVTDTIKLMNGATEIDSATFIKDGGNQSLYYTVTEDVTLTLSGATAAAVTPIFVTTSAKGYDQFGDEVTNAAQVANVKTIKVQFNVAMDKTTVETKDNWTDATLDITKVVYDEATKTATFTVTGAANNASITAKANVKAADGVAMATTSVITLHNADAMITVANI